MDAATAQALKEHISYDPVTGRFTVIKHYGPMKPGDTPGASKTHGYRTIGFRYKTYPEHHLAWFFVYGVIPQLTIDHINGIRDDNRIENLREVSFAENCRNRRRMKNNTSGVQGVSFSPRHQMWKVSIRANGRDVFLGYYRTIDEASIARRAAERALGYHKNHGNIVDTDILKAS